MTYQPYDLIKESIEIIKSQQFSNTEDLAAQLAAVYAELDAMQQHEYNKQNNSAIIPSWKLNKQVILGNSSEKEDIVASSVQEDYIVCLEDLTKHKILKRYLKKNYGLSWEEYIVKHNLPLDYPSCCKSFSKAKSILAKRIGLGKNIKPLKSTSPKPQLF